MSLLSPIEKFEQPTLKRKSNTFHLNKMKSIFVLCLFLVIFGVICNGQPLDISKWLDECLRKNKGNIQKELGCQVSEFLWSYQKLYYDHWEQNWIHLFSTLIFQQAASMYATAMYNINQNIMANFKWFLHWNNENGRHC